MKVLHQSWSVLQRSILFIKAEASDADHMSSGTGWSLGPCGLWLATTALFTSISPPSDLWVRPRPPSLPGPHTELPLCVLIQQPFEVGHHAPPNFKPSPSTVIPSFEAKSWGHRGGRAFQGSPDTWKPTKAIDLSNSKGPRSQERQDYTVLLWEEQGK